MIEGVDLYKYIRIMRVDHWIKQCFILPGCFLGLFFFSVDSMYADISIFHRFFIGMISASFIASSNYVINEWLDAEFDQYHPVKKHRSVVESNLNSHIVYDLYFHD